MSRWGHGGTINGATQSALPVALTLQVPRISQIAARFKQGGREKLGIPAGTSAPRDYLYHLGKPTSSENPSSGLAAHSVIAQKHPIYKALGMDPCAGKMSQGFSRSV